jgi:hypothetical protein
MDRLKKLWGLAGTAYSGLKKAIGYSAAATVATGAAVAADKVATDGKYLIKPVVGTVEEGFKRFGQGAARTESYTNWIGALGSGLLSGQSLKGFLAGMVDLLVSLGVVQKGGSWDKWANEIKAQAHQTDAASGTSVDDGPAGGSPNLAPASVVGLGAGAAGLGLGAMKVASAAATKIDPVAAGMSSAKQTVGIATATASTASSSTLAGRVFGFLKGRLGIGSLAMIGGGAAITAMTANSGDASAATQNNTIGKATTGSSVATEVAATAASIATPMAAARVGAPALAVAFPGAAGTLANVPVLGGIVGMGIAGEGVYSSVKGYMDGSKTGKEALLNAFGAAVEGVSATGGFLTYGLGASAREGIRAAAGEGVEKSFARQGLEDVGSWLKNQFFGATNDTKPSVSVPAPAMRMEGGFSFAPM